MDVSLVLFIVIIVFVVYFSVPWCCQEEYFTAAKAPSQVTPTERCPNGGTIDERSLCSDRVQGTYGCSVGYTKESYGFCYNKEHTSKFVPGYQCPSNYDYDYDKKNGTCVRTYGKPTLSCPEGYSLTTTSNKGYICKKD